MAVAALFANYGGLMCFILQRKRIVQIVFVFSSPQELGVRLLPPLLLIAVDLMFNPGGFSSIVFAAEFPKLGLTESS